MHELDEHFIAMLRPNASHMHLWTCSCALDKPNVIDNFYMNLDLYSYTAYFLNELLGDSINFTSCPHTCAEVTHWASLCVHRSQYLPIQLDLLVK